MVARNLAWPLAFASMALRTKRDSRRSRGPKSACQTSAFSANQRMKTDFELAHRLMSNPAPEDGPCRSSRPYADSRLPPLDRATLDDRRRSVPGQLRQDMLRSFVTYSGGSPSRRTRKTSETKDDYGSHRWTCSWIGCERPQCLLCYADQLILRPRILVS